MANFHSHRFPGTLKTAQVLPCRRSHAWTRMILLAIDQYPINLSTISKILERLALNSLRPQMLGLPLYCKLQSAYRRGHSTETALLHILNGVYSALDSKRAALLVVLDISAAFNTISHSLLLCCLESDYGVRSNVLKWIQSYVMERIQFVKLGRHTSATSPCTAGIYRKAQFSGRCFSRPTWLRLAVLLSRSASATTSFPMIPSSSSHGGLNRSDLRHTLF